MNYDNRRHLSPPRFAYYFVAFFCFSKFVYRGVSADHLKVNLFPIGEETVFTFHSTVSIDGEKYYTGNDERDVGYQITGSVDVSSIWENPGDVAEKLLHLQISNLKLQTKSPKNPAKVENLKTHLEKLKNDPFIIHWKDFTVHAVYVDTNEDDFLINLKKSLSGLLQFQFATRDANENDICGICKVSYEPLDPKTLRKHVHECDNNLPKQIRIEKMLGVNISSKRTVLYEFYDQSLSRLNRITSYENHLIKMMLDEKVAMIVTGTIDLTMHATRKQSFINLLSKSLTDAIQEMKTIIKSNLQHETLPIKKLSLTADNRHREQSLKELVIEHYHNLAEKNLGTVKSATSFASLLKAFRNANEKEIVAVLKNKRNQPILNQLCDLIGAAQTVSAHKALMNGIEFTQKENLNSAERYLLALSLGRCPNEDILKDLFTTWTDNSLDEKLEETLILTITALARKLNDTHNIRKYLDNALSSIMDKISACNNETCKAVYLRALKNLPDDENVPILVNYALTGSRVTSVAAVKTLYFFPKSYWNRNVLKMAENIYYQIYRKYDSTARAVAVDILLEANPDDDSLKNILFSIQSFDQAYETKRYVLERIKQISSVNKQFAETIRKLLNSTNLNNYNFLARKGLSNAMATSLCEYSGVNVMLHSINEVFNGIMKRSIISVDLIKQGEIFRVLSFIAYSSGLSTFIWSDSSEDDLNEPEDTTAGMELMIFGTQTRPYVFFTGHGELMSHLWAGTATERTPAFQAIMLLHDHKQYIPLASGDLVQLDFSSSASFELAAQIDFSIWNRNAKSLVQTLCGVYMHGSVSIENPFIGSALDFDVSSDLSLDLVSDLDFYGDIALCVRLSHPDSSVRYNIYKKEWTPDDQHKFLKTESRSLFIPGRTFALGRMNNEMCGVIFPR